jgi:hypothetical protein
MSDNDPLGAFMAGFVVGGLDPSRARRHAPRFSSRVLSCRPGHRKPWARRAKRRTN